jgi:hypothetical protein
MIQAHMHYRHYKGGLYKVLTLAKSADDERELVVYQAVQTGVVWVRDAEEFNEDIAPGIKRFARVWP